ncbi:MAG: arginine deiminase family protein, partial [Bacteroidales bacterium]
MAQIDIALNSEVGKLNGVILHKPGKEIECMTPSTIQEALYSDLLSREIAQKEYRQIEGFLSRQSSIFYIDDLLLQTLEKEEARIFLFEKLSTSDRLSEVLPLLKKLEPKELSRCLIEGIPQTPLMPLYNLYFTRDIGVCFNQKSMPSHMATKVREREVLITEVIYKFHPLFMASSSYINPWKNSKVGTKLEGGDFLVVDENIFLIGQGVRSNKEGVDAFIEEKKKTSDLFYIITQELPVEPESFIHLDMVFTLLSRMHCMLYAPLILEGSRYQTLLLTVKNGKITEEIIMSDILSALSRLGKAYKPILCGGRNRLYQDREQWHSGANFFAVAPGKILGYGRNLYTIEALNK